MSEDPWKVAMAQLGLPQDCPFGARQHLSADRCVITEKRPTRRFLLIVDGQLSVSSGGQQIRVLEQGEWCGEIGLLRRLKTNDGSATATVKTLTEADVITFAPWEFKALVDTYPTVARRLCATAKRRLRHSDVGE